MAEQQSNDLGAEDLQRASSGRDDVETVFQPEQSPIPASSHALLQLKSLFISKGLMSNVSDEPGYTSLTQVNGHILKAGDSSSSGPKDVGERLNDNSLVSDTGTFENQNSKQENSNDESILSEIVTILENNRILDNLETVKAESNPTKIKDEQANKGEDQIDPLDKAILKKEKQSSSQGRLHPPAPGKCDHIQDLEILSKDIKKACENGIGKETTYSGVYVLLMSWGDADNLGVSSELDLVEEVFRERYDFNVQRFVIPDNKSCGLYTSRAIDDFQLEHSDPNSLYIIYYGGHGRVGDDDQCCYLGPTGKFTREVDWNPIQNRLVSAEQDTLILLDCCSASAAVTRQTKLTSTTEVLRAGAREVEAQGYTKEPVLYVDKIAEKLVSEPQATNLYETQPFWWPVNGRDSPSIGLRVANPTAAPRNPEKLRPRKPTLPKAQDHLELPASASVDGSRSSMEGWKSTTDPTEMTPSEASEPHAHKALISVHISENVTAEKLKAQTVDWVNWLKRAPEGVESLKDIKFEADFTTGSSLLLLAVPVRLWLHLRDDPAYNFLGFVQSSNLLIEKSEPVPTPAAVPSTVHAQYSSIKDGIEELKSFHLDAKKARDKNSSEMRVTLEKLTQHLNDISDKVKRTDSGKWLTEEEKKAGIKWMPFQKDKEKQKTRDNQTVLRNSLSEIGKEIQEVKGILVEFKVKFDMENAPDLAKEENGDMTSSDMQGNSLMSRPVLASAITVS